MHAPVLDYLLSILRAHRASGRIHVGIARGVDEYIRDVIRLADAKALSGPEALVAANRALTDALALPQIQGDRHAPR